MLKADKSASEPTFGGEAGESSFHSSENSLEQRTTVTAIGKVKTFAGLEAAEWAFLTISVLNVLIAIGITIDRLVELNKGTPDYTFAIILFINIGFCLFYAVHGVLREREFELYVYIVGIVVLLAYILVDLIANDEHRSTLKWVRFGAIIALGIPNICFAIKVAQGFGYLAFRTVGASESVHTSPCYPPRLSRPEVSLLDYGQWARSCGIDAGEKRDVLQDLPPNHHAPSSLFSLQCNNAWGRGSHCRD